MRYIYLGIYGTYDYFPTVGENCTKTWNGAKDLAFRNARLELRGMQRLIDASRSA